MGIIADKIRQSIYGIDVREDIAQGIEVTEQLRADYDQQVINAGNSNAEIVAARGGEVNLNTRINKIDSSLSDKANTIYVDTKFGNMGNTKTFKGSCTNAELIAKTGMLVDDYWYITDLTTNKCYNGAIWVDIGNNLKIGDNTITPIKTNFFTTYGKNLIDKNNLIVGKFINYLTGLEGVNVNYSCTGFIEIEPSTSYVCNDNKQVAFYDSDKVYVSGVMSNAFFTTPTTAKYLRTSLFTVDINEIQLEKGTECTTYEARKDVIKNENIQMSQIATYVSQNMSKASIEPINLSDSLVTSLNLFDKTTATINFSVQSINGELAANANYYSSDYIKVKPTTNYIVSPFYCPQMALYDVNKTYISGLNDAVSFATPSNCAYMRMSVRKTDFDVFQVEIGYTPTQHKDFSYILNSDIIGTGTIDVTKLSMSPFNKTVTVKATGGDYTTIGGAIAGETGTKYQNVDIIIDSGVYIEELVLKDYINLIGVNRDTVILKSLPGTDNHYNRDVIKAQFNSTVKNLTINAQNTKYCVHADAIGEYTFTIENCVLDKLNIEGFSVPGGYGNAIGLGLRGNQNFKIKNCIIRGDYGALYMHTLNNQTSNSRLEIENSKLTGSFYTGLTLESLGSGMTDLVILKGNIITGAFKDILTTRGFAKQRDDLVIIAEGNEVHTYATANGSLVPFVQPVIVETVVSSVTL